MNSYISKTKSTDFFKRLGKLPKEAQDFFISQELSEDIGVLTKKFNLEQGFLAALAGDLVAGAVSFDELSKTLTEYLGDELNEQTIREVAINFLGVAFLPVVQYLGKNINEQIKKLGGNPAVFAGNVSKFQNRLQAEKKAKAEKGFAKYVDSIDMVSEKEGFIELFKNDLVDVLSSGSSDIKEQLNVNLLILLNKGDDLQKTLLNTLSGSQEKLTHKEFILDGKPYSPSIANWLRCFIKTNGSGMFDNMALVKFITSSDNVKKLDGSERELLRKLLVLYRNLNFFPDSLNNLSVEQLEIIPIEEARKADKKTGVVLGIPKTAEEKEVESLKESAQKYPEGSLERRAVEEEIEKMNHK